MSKTLWTLLPLLLWYPVFLLVMFMGGAIGTATAQKLDFHFPKYFEGRVIVIGDMPCGQPVTIEHNREQLFVPENGILLYRGKLKYGVIDHKYYRLLEGGTKTELPARDDLMDTKTKKLSVDTNSLSVMLLRMLDEKNAHDRQYTLIELLVVPKDSMDKYSNSQSGERIKALTDSSTLGCK